MEILQHRQQPKFKKKHLLSPNPTTQHDEQRRHAQTKIYGLCCSMTIYDYLGFDSVVPQLQSAI